MSTTEESKPEGANPSQEDLENEKQPGESAAAEVTDKDGEDLEAAGNVDVDVDVDETEKLREENQFLLDQLQRSRAELKNFRRRTAEERSQHELRATADLFRRVLPLFDSLIRAMNAGEKSEAEEETDTATALEKLREGVRIIVDEFHRLLGELRIEVIAAAGEPFDPAVHEAVFQKETDEYPPGQVIEEFERGYRAGEILVRAAKVIVAKAPAGDGG